MSTAWAHIENLVVTRIGALKADDEAVAETNYRVIPKTATQVSDAAFPVSSVRDEIVAVTVEVVAAICKNEGDTRRTLFAQTVFAASGLFIPTSMGPLGTIRDQSTGRPLVERSLSEVAERKANPGGLWTEPVYFYAISGDKIFHTVANAEITFFNYDRPATTYAQLDALFDTTGDNYPLGDEFAVVIADGAAGRLCMKAGSMVQEGRGYLEAYYTALKERGINLQPFQFPAYPAN